MSSRSKQIFFDAYFNLPYKKIQITFYVLSILYVRCALKVYSISRTAGSKKKKNTIMQRHCKKNKSAVHRGIENVINKQDFCNPASKKIHPHYYYIDEQFNVHCKCL